MMWCLPSLPTGRIGRLVVLNSALPPHPLLAELGLANALLVAIWQATVALVGRFMPVSYCIYVCLAKLLRSTAKFGRLPCSATILCYLHLVYSISSNKNKHSPAAAG
jgi:hypothetical protein